MCKRILTLVSTMVLFFAILSGCSEEKPKPEEALSQYIKLWNQKDFNKMYALLAADVQKGKDKKEFVSRYKDIYKDIEVKNLKVSFQVDKPTKKPEDIKKRTFTYKLQMDTLAGPISYKDKITVVKEKQKEEKIAWKIDWDTSMIFKQLKPKQLIGIKTIPAERGEIFDRNGDGLAVNSYAIEIGLFPKVLKQNKSEEAKRKLSEWLNIPTSYIENQLSQSWVGPETFVPIKTVPKDSKVIDKTITLEAVLTRKTAARVYPCDKACAHLTGYVGTITAEELKKYEEKGYNSQSVIGKRGLELIYEDKLRAKDGVKIYLESPEGEIVTTVAKKEPQNGQDLHLTIDMQTQKAIYNQLKKDAGTAVALHPKTGDVLALVSAPAFSPNTFTLGITGDKYQALLSSKDKPLITRFAQTYTPGSTMKPLTAAIGLKTGKLDPTKTMTITGPYHKDKSWGDYHVNRVNSQTNVNLHDALMYSDNIYFARTALNIGGEAFVSGLNKMGIGEPALPFPFPMEASQISNSGKLKDEILLANTGYGQGEVNINPLHLATLYTMFVNNGDVAEPHLFQDKKPKLWIKDVLKPNQTKIIKEALVDVVENPGGTAYHPSIDGLTLAGKTGTAEFKKSQEVEEGRENGWFVAFNTQNSELLIAMMVENTNSHDVVDKVKTVYEKLLK